jgi:prepilin-type N-terminal cleavage/methylation domain-containing protein/prepilin-type processing-associated H-X9-DG protein
MKDRMTDRNKGFTLIELLVVISIIALLMSIMLPTLSKAREAGNRVKCLSQLKQVHMAGYMYGKDHKHAWTRRQYTSTDATLPFGIPRYLGIEGKGTNPTILTCPSAQNQRPTYGWTYNYTYSINRSATFDAKHATRSAQHWEDVLKPAEQGYFHDGASTFNNPTRGYFYETDIRGTTPFPTAAATLGYPHMGTNNTVYVDGHAKPNDVAFWVNITLTTNQYHIFWQGK